MPDLNAILLKTLKLNDPAQLDGLRHSHLGFALAHGAYSCH